MEKVGFRVVGQDDKFFVFLKLGLDVFEELRG